MTSYQWDPEKAASNLAKHGISFEFATEVFDDPNLVVTFSRQEGGEKRWMAIGRV